MRPSFATLVYVSAAAGRVAGVAMLAAAALACRAPVTVVDMAAPRSPWVDGEHFSVDALTLESEAVTIRGGDAPRAVEFFATSHAPCRPATMALRDLVAKHPAIDLVLLSIDEDKPDLVDTLRYYVGILGIDSRRVRRLVPSAEERLRVRSVPMLVVVDVAGTVVGSHLGYGDDYVTRVEALLRRAEDAGAR